MIMSYYIRAIMAEENREAPAAETNPEEDVEPAAEGEKTEPSEDEEPAQDEEHEVAKMTIDDNAGVAETAIDDSGM